MGLYWGLRGCECCRGYTGVEGVVMDVRIVRFVVSVGVAEVEVVWIVEIVSVFGTVVFAVFAIERRQLAFWRKKIVSYTVCTKFISASIFYQHGDHCSLNLKSLVTNKLYALYVFIIGF